MKVFRIFSIIFLFLFLPQISFAQSSYVLPYPSSMPGSFAYKLHLVFENVSRYWYFGDFGQFDYNLKMADKYLVQAKTLFEYKQYLLGYKALQKSDLHFAKIIPSLGKASHKKKDISGKKTILSKAAQKHIEVLEKTELETPDVFNWQPEKALPTNIYLKKDIEKSIDIRRSNL